MPPKDAKKLRERLERENEEPAKGKSRTAEGMETPNPKRGEFFSNLEKAAKSS